MLKLLFFLITVFSMSTLYAQIQVQNTQTPEQLVQNVLLGGGITATNITYNGSPVNATTVQGNVTFFNAQNQTFPLASGLLLTTGNGVGAIGPNDIGSDTQNLPATPDVSAEPDLNAIANGSVTNGVFLEFDFIPSGDTLNFRYMFGSEEYPEFSPSSFNDAFGFFLSGPGINGTFENNAINLAQLPGLGIPVTINNVNPTTNSNFYVDNGNGATYGSSIQYDGTTVLLTAGASVQCGETYHIKLAISNVFDQSYDSGVFLEANSFGSNAVSVSVTTVTGDSTVIEGCTQANFIFTRPESQTGDTLVINYDLFGSATDSVDYPSIPENITFLPGEDSVVISLVPYADGLDEAPEFITITVYTITACGDTLATQGTIVILDQSLAVDTLIQTPTSSCVPDGAVVGIVEGAIGNVTYQWIGPGTGEFADTVYTALWQNRSPGWYYFTANDMYCTISDSVLVEINNAPVASFDANVVSGCTPLEVQFTNTSQNANTFEWTFGNGQNTTVTNLSTQTTVYTESTVAQLVVFQGPCSDTASVAIAISICGCTDPTATNYNPAAQVNDGSCIYPLPTVEAPNVFTPDGDGANEFFELTVTNAASVQITILNRWGNVMYDQTGSNPYPTWNGLDKSGVKAGEGTYFYKYVVTGLTGQTLEGHGFVQLIRKP
jgi:gliding motility-associated-like protein